MKRILHPRVASVARIGVVLLAGVPASAAWSASAFAQEAAAPAPAPVQADSGAGDLGAWSRSVIERALGRAGSDAGSAGAGPTAPSTPALTERHVPPPGPAAAGTAEILLFTSLSVPAASWRHGARDAARIGAGLVLRGVAGEGLTETARQVRARLGAAKAGVAIDPRLFRLFGIQRVPAVVVVPGGVPPCRSRGCAGDDPPPFDRVTGNLSLAAALEAIAAEGGPGRAAARRHLKELRGAAR